jgi:hypothetical protein
VYELLCNLANFLIHFFQITTNWLKLKTKSRNDQITTYLLQQEIWFIS